MIRKVSHWKHRSPKGNMLVLILAVTLGIITALVIFMMSYVRLMGTQSEQKTAIEAAALAAAREMSKIVVNTPQFGYVGLSDSAPNGTDTQSLSGYSTDGYSTSVHSINTLLGTSLVDYLVAEDIGPTRGGTEMKELARQDLSSARSAADALLTALQASITPTGSGKDKDGNTVRPYQEALNAYNSNSMRIAGSSSYVNGSLQLSLGAINGGAPTNVRLPVGWSSSWPAAQTANGRYKSYTTFSRGGNDWVFAGIDETVKLIDPTKFVASASGLPYQHATILRAQATQSINDNGTTRNIQSSACAQPASVYDPLPCPGALVASYPDGPPTGACTHRHLSDLVLDSGCMNDGNDDCDILTSNSGDFPVDGGSLIYNSALWPLGSLDPNHKAHNACKIAIYDWLRRGGTKVNIGAVKNAIDQDWGAAPGMVAWAPAGGGSIPGGIAYIYRFATNGDVTFQAKTIKPQKYYVVGEKQVIMESLEVLTNGAPSVHKVSNINLGPAYPGSTGEAWFETNYDMYLRDFGRTLGRSSGGKHAGEPIDDPLVAHKAPDNSAGIKVACSSLSGNAICPAVFSGGLGAKTKSQGPPAGLGAVPLIGPQNDFAYVWGGATPSLDPSISKYKTYAAGGAGLRQTYQTNGTVAEIRFRRQVDVYIQSTTTDPDTGATTTTSVKVDDGYVQLK
ncbi:MAG: hypothetical protein SFY67_09085 [Candidatus Melainabacteria bacterium]|nr:hypothetical protein [Candidatus Melainabacteria bacterium]